MKTHWQILVVDDEEVMCESLAAWLREDGYVVDTAASGRAATRPRTSRAGTKQVSMLSALSAVLRPRARAFERTASF